MQNCIPPEKQFSLLWNKIHWRIYLEVVTCFLGLWPSETDWSQLLRLLWVLSISFPDSLDSLPTGHLTIYNTTGSTLYLRNLGCCLDPCKWKNAWTVLQHWPLGRGLPRIQWSNVPQSTCPFGPFLLYTPYCCILFLRFTKWHNMTGLLLHL
jgi:hypothetical protein